MSDLKFTFNPFKLVVEEVVYEASLVPKKICWD